MPNSTSRKTPNIVFTKPAHQGHALQSLINTDSQNVALFDIEFFGDQAASRDTLLDLAEFTHIVVTSPNAASALLALMDQYWPMLPEDPKWFCPGAGTAKALAADYQFPIQAIYPSSGSSSEDIVKLAEFEIDDLSKVLVVKGEGGRTFMQEQVSSQGGKVSELNLYRRHEIELTLSQKSTILAADLLVVSSLEVLLALEKQCVVTKAEQKPNITLLVTSQRLAGYLLDNARELNSSSIISSTNPSIIQIQKADNESIADAVNHWHKDFNL